MNFMSEKFSGILEKEVSLDYLLYLPEEYKDEKNEKWPLILFLHGIGERGDNVEVVRNQGLPKYIEENGDFNFITICPQCPQNSFWTRETDNLYALIKNIVSKYNVDSSRIYITGLSMGGFGTWHMAETYPSLFAAAVPICGGTEPMIGFPERIAKIKDLPVWAFHGSLDKVVPFQKTQELVEELHKVDGKIKFTLYFDGEHDVWTRTYNDKSLYKWLLEQKKMI